MQPKSFTGAELANALKQDTFTMSGVELVGMVKSSENEGHISFTRAGCDSWIEVPIALIEQAEHLGQNRCKDHTHPVFKITLKQPKDPEALIFSALLAQRPPMPLKPASMPNPTTPQSPFQTPTSVRGGGEIRRANFGFGPAGRRSAGHPIRIPQKFARIGLGGGFGNIWGNGLLNEWGCWDSECCDCVEWECIYDGVHDDCVDYCVNYECSPCERCIWPW